MSPALEVESSVLRWVTTHEGQAKAAATPSRYHERFAFTIGRANGYTELAETHMFLAKEAT